MRQTKLDPKRQALLAERAHGMRHAPTALWRELSARKLGVAFRRQVPLGGRYIADFVAPTALLVIEVDGAAQDDMGWLATGKVVTSNGSARGSLCNSAS